MNKKQSPLTPKGGIIGRKISNLVHQFNTVASIRFSTENHLPLPATQAG